MLRKVIITEFMSLDGVVEAPEQWSFPYWNNETESFKNDELTGTVALLLGRATYEGFAAAWPGRTGDYADRFNSLTKYVASASLKTLPWKGSEQLSGDLADDIARIKKAQGGDIVLHGSISLAQSLIKQGLADQINLLVYPIVLGKGRRLFPEGQQAKLKLVESKAFSNGVVSMTYRPDV
jgi:dihydrofolate reductase